MDALIVAATVLLFVAVMLVGLSRARPSRDARSSRRMSDVPVALPGVPWPAMLVELGSRRITNLDVKVPSDVGVIRLSTPGHELSSFWGGRDLTVGDAAFDRRYCVQANPPELAHELLDGATRDRVLRLDGVSESFILELRPGLLRVRTSRTMDEAGRKGFLADAAAVAARILEVGTKGVRVESVAEHEGRCLVCGCAVAPSRSVRCTACQAPHHADCWEYNGGCSMFGCRGGRA
jgi:hypothetical protein